MKKLRGLIISFALIMALVVSMTACAGAVKPTPIPTAVEPISNRENKGRRKVLITS